MNTTHHAQTPGDKFPAGSLNTKDIQFTQAKKASDKPEETFIIHDAKIITPRPYGVFALCKIFEHLQIN